MYKAAVHIFIRLFLKKSSVFHTLLIIFSVSSRNDGNTKTCPPNAVCEIRNVQRSRVDSVGEYLAINLRAVLTPTSSLALVPPFLLLLSPSCSPSS